MCLDGYFDYWGKARDQAQLFHLVAFHALDVAAVGVELLERDARWLQRIAALSGFSPESLRKVLPYLLALHDLGKFSEPFQDQRPDLVEQLQGPRPARQCNLRHDTIGYLLWWDWASYQPDEREAGLLEALHAVALPAGPVCRRDLGEVMQSWMAAVLSHHGKPPAPGALSMDVFKALPDAPLARSRRDAAAFALAAKEVLAPGELVSELDDLDALIVRTKRASWWVAGFAILCDWLGSDTTFFRYESEPRRLELYWADARQAAAEAVKRSGLVGSAPRPFGGLEKLFPLIASQPSPLQQAASEIDLGTGPQLFVIEDLTGSGKTEAALVLAQRLMSSGRGDGLFFALPTMATANAMDGRVKPLLEVLFEGDPSYLLTHSGPRLTERDQLALAGGAHDDAYGRDEQPTASSAASDWLSDGRKKALLAELGVGTIDQALLAALQSKHAALRLLGLQRRVLVVDEVHACDAYMLGILCALLRMHAALGGSAILLSATLPKEQRQKLTRAFAEGLGEKGAAVPSSLEYPLLTGFGAGRVVEHAVAPREGSRRTLPIRWHDAVESVVSRIIEAARSGQCACWVRNSVKDATEAYEAVAGALGSEHATLFHARFALGDRLKIEQGVVDRFGQKGTGEQRKGRVVIATQVVEQSLDIDFDVMVSDLCPIDLLIQRAGRLQRHPKLHPVRMAPVLEILAPTWSEAPPSDWLGGAFSRTARVYTDPGVLWRTARELQRLGQLSLPENARALMESVHGDGDTPASLERRSSAAMGEELAHASMAQNAVLELDLGYLREGVDWSSEARTPTRLGEPTTTVRLARVDERGARPWCAEVEPRLQWPLSQVSIARRLVAKAATGDEALRQTLEATQPFVGDDVVTALLREERQGIWSGRAVSERTRGGVVTDVPVRITYSEQRGLDVRDEE
jgi:CRISPR-associated endonuclease/helicase Cas3